MLQVKIFKKFNEETTIVTFKLSIDICVCVTKVKVKKKGMRRKNKDILHQIVIHLFLISFCFVQNY